MFGSWAWRGFRCAAAVVVLTGAADAWQMTPNQTFQFDGLCAAYYEYLTITSKTTDDEFRTLQAAFDMSMLGALDDGMKLGMTRRQAYDKVTTFRADYLKWYSKNKPHAETNDDCYKNLMRIRAQLQQENH